MDLSCPDWRDRLRTGRSLVPESLPLDRQRGDLAVRVWDMLRLADVPGNPEMSAAGGDWFRAIIRALFGSIDVQTGERWIRELFLLTPKKSAKTSQGALLMLTALLLNLRPRATFLLTAPVQEVSDLAFDQVAGAIGLDDVLSKKLHVREHLKTIVHRETKAELQIITFDPAVVTGQKPAGVLIDELHVIAKMGKAASAIRQLRGGMLPFPDSFLVFITTQSEEPPSGVFKAELHKARRIRDGQQQGAMLPVLYEFPEEMQRDPEQWRNPKNWPMVSPNLGRSMTLSRLEEEFITAEASGPEELRAWASQHLNIEIGLALKTDRWSGADFWEAAGTTLTLEQLLERSEVVTIGIDGGGLDDLLGLAVVGREVGTGKWLHWAHAWMHPIVLERHKQETGRFRDFQADGDLTIVESIGEDLAELASYVDQVESSDLLDRVGVDAAGIGSILDALRECGIEGDRVLGIPQGWRMVGAIKTAERKLAEKMFEHGASSLMAWCVGNAKVEPRGNAVIITKQGAGNAKIDPLLATLNAVALMSLNPQQLKKRYELFTV